MALMAFLQMVDSNMAVGREPKEGHWPPGSDSEAIVILKGQKLSLPFDLWIMFQHGKMVNNLEGKLRSSTDFISEVTI